MSAPSLPRPELFRRRRPDRVPRSPPEAYQFRLVIDEFKFETLCDVRHRRDNMVGVFFPRAYAVAETEKRPNGQEIVHGIREAMRAHS
jgi:hypothetical protein